MLNKSLIQYVNRQVLKHAKGLQYSVKADAPSTETALFSSTSLVVWSGASDSTIYQDALVNYAFRAWHDSLHLATGLDFSVDAEIELGRMQANQCDSDLMRELVFCEVAGQAMHYRNTGKFVENQVEFTVNYLKSKGLLK